MIRSERRPLVFLTRHPTDDDRRDGFYQRVAAIDDLLCDQERVYLRTDGPATQISVSSVEVGDKATEVRISRRNPLHRHWASRLVRQSRAVYAHSILTVESQLAQTLFRSAPTRVLDLHGAVPEEALLMGDSERASELDRLESKILPLADLLIGVSARLLDHATQKSGRSRRESDLVLPILTDSGPVQRDPNRTGVIYAGGIQPWQQVNKMAAFVHDHPELVATFLTPDPGQMRSLIGAPCESAAVPPSGLGSWYRRRLFGLILRQGNTVNRVASPTKLSEYLRHGLVPIVDSPDIGDFPAMDYRWVSCSSPLPGQKECEEIVAQNDCVLSKLEATFRKSAGAFRAWISERDQRG